MLEKDSHLSEKINPWRNFQDRIKQHEVYRHNPTLGELWERMVNAEKTAPQRRAEIQRKSP